MGKDVFVEENTKRLFTIVVVIKKKIISLFFTRRETRPKTGSMVNEKTGTSKL